MTVCRTAFGIGTLDLRLIRKSIVRDGAFGLQSVALMKLFFRRKLVRDQSCKSWIVEYAMSVCEWASFSLHCI